MNVIKQYPTALTIAGSDSSGGAGIQADLKTFSSLGVFGASAITAITAQNTMGVKDVQTIDAPMVEAQIEAVLDDIKIDSIKIGMLHAPEIVKIVAEAIDRYSPEYVVLDPVMMASSGDSLMKDGTVPMIRQLLFSRATLVTPNISEVEYLTEMEIKTEKDMIKAGRALLDAGCKGVLLKGGHLKGNRKTDILMVKGRNPLPFSETYIDSKNTHGTGCTLSAAITAYLSLGCPLEKAVKKAKRYITNAIAAGSNVKIGNGYGPLNHFFDPKKLLCVGR